MRERKRVTRLRVLGSVCVLGLIIGGCGKAETHADGPSAPVASVPAASNSAAPDSARGPIPVRLSPEGSRLTQESASLAALRERQGSPPVKVELDGVTSGAAVVPVGLDPNNGDLAVPASALAVAWYEAGPTPGQSGISVLAAHVDWHGRARCVLHTEERPHRSDGHRVARERAHGTLQSDASAKRWRKAISTGYWSVLAPAHRSSPSSPVAAISTGTPTTTRTTSCCSRSRFEHRPDDDASPPLVPPTESFVPSQLGPAG